MTGGWRRYAGAALVFLVALVCFDRALFTAIHALHTRLELEAEVPRKLAALEHASEYQWLILGTSRTFEAIHPAFIEREFGVRAFKEASKGKGLRYQYEFYRLYKRMVGTPRVVIVGLDYFMFGLPSDPALLRRLGQAPSAASGATAFWPPLRLVAGKADTERAVVRVLEQVQSRFVSALDTFDPEGRVGDMHAYTGNPASNVVARAAPATFERVAYARFPGLEGAYFARLLEECAADGTAVALVYPPDYIATHLTNTEHGAFMAEVRQAAASHPRCVVLDYADPARFPISTAGYFWDGGYGSPNSHLSKAGVEVFNRVWLPDLRQAVERFGVAVGRNAGAAPGL